MAGISQTIPSFYGGISQQADELKNPGQVKDSINAIPDLTWGLYKRPGAKRITSPDTGGKLNNVPAQSGTNVSWFHYYRDESEGSYIGSIDTNGLIRVWKASGKNAGDEQTVVYGNTAGATETNLKAYLAHGGTSERLQTITINDTTIITNRSQAVTMSSTTAASSPNPHEAFIELLRTENGRQYGLNIYDRETDLSTVKTATRLKINSTTLDTDWGTGNCPGIGTQVFGGESTNTGNQKNLIFRITVLGQVGDNSQDDNVSVSANGFRCAYSKNVDLLFGGEDWDTDDTTTVTLDSADGGDSSGNDATYTVKVLSHSTSQVKAYINGGTGKGLIRPEPTPFDGETAVTADQILGGITAEIGARSTGVSHKIIGNGLYLSDSDTFNVEVCHPDLMRVMQKEINDVSKLPTQCKNGYIVKVTNSQVSDEDDYWLKFVGQNGKDGPGSWVETTEPGIRTEIDPATMPIKIARTSIANQGASNEMATFTVDRIDWNDRIVGDDTTNAIPEFVSRRTAYGAGHSEDEDRFINKVLFFRNRLTFLAGKDNNASWVVTSRPGDLYNFWSDTALTVSNKDPINITSSSTLPSSLFDGVETAAGLLVFTSNSQYLLASDDAIFNPDTAKLRVVSNYNYNKNIPPLSLGTTVGFIDNSNKYSKFFEMIGARREGDATIIDQTKVVPTLLDQDIDLIANSRENGLVFFGKSNTNKVYCYKYVTVGDQRIQSSWFTWQFKNNIKYHFVIDDQYYFLDTDNYLQSINLIQSDTDPSIEKDGTNFLINLDNYTTIHGGTYNASTDITTFTGVSWLSHVTDGDEDLVLVDTVTSNDRKGRYVSCTVSGTTITVKGNWQENTSSSDPLHIGYLYDYQVDLPRIYTTKRVGDSTVSDVTASLIIHRLNLSFGKIGLYETTLNRIGKLNYTDVHESSTLSAYNVSDAPYLTETIKTIPVYDKNENVNITIKSTHPAPATLRSLSWEGDYSPMHYRRG